MRICGWLEERCFKNNIRLDCTGLVQYDNAVGSFAITRSSAMTPKPASRATYPIGVTSRLTNIHPETLRIWERRYRMVAPARASRGRRFYSEEDVRRLSLLKALVDEGNPISAVAALSIDELEARVKGRAATTLKLRGTTVAGPCRVVVVGEELPILLSGVTNQLEIVASSAEAKDLPSAGDAAVVDVLVWERASLHAGALSETMSLLTTSRARRAMVVYGFAAKRVVAELEAVGIRCVQARAGADAIVRACLEERGRSGLPLEISVPGSQVIPPRRFPPGQLARIARSSPTMACECPHHLVDLVNSLVAFERYSAECESRSPSDAALHALLHSITATARALMESGLERVIEAEGIEP